MPGLWQYVQLLLLSSLNVVEVELAVLEVVESELNLHDVETQVEACKLAIVR